MPIGKDNKFDKESDQKTNRREFKVVIVRICVFIKSKEEIYKYPRHNHIWNRYRNILSYNSISDLREWYINREKIRKMINQSRMLIIENILCESPIPVINPYNKGKSKDKFKGSKFKYSNCFYWNWYSNKIANNPIISAYP